MRYEAASDGDTAKDRGYVGKGMDFGREEQTMPSLRKPRPLGSLWAR